VQPVQYSTAAGWLACLAGVVSKIGQGERNAQKQSNTVVVVRFFRFDSIPRVVRERKNYYGTETGISSPFSGGKKLLPEKNNVYQAVSTRTPFRFAELPLPSRGSPHSSSCKRENVLDFLITVLAVSVAGYVHAVTLIQAIFRLHSLLCTTRPPTSVNSDEGSVDQGVVLYSSDGCYHRQRCVDTGTRPSRSSCESTRGAVDDTTPKEDFDEGALYVFDERKRLDASRRSNRRMPPIIAII